MIHKRSLSLLVTGLAMAAVGAAAQVPISLPSDAWSPPAGSKISISKATGRMSIVVPAEINARKLVDPAFNNWRKTPFAGTGPMPATRVEDPSLPTHTLYYPKALAAHMPVLLWANGGCRNTSVEFTRFLGELASRGYFIVAVGRNDVAFANFDGSDLTPAAGTPPLTTRGGQVLLDGLNWAQKENARPGSKYFGKLDLSKVAALGQSCGGGQAWAASKDPRIKAVAAMNSNFPSAKGGTGPLAAPPADGWTVEQLKIPAAYFIGGPADVAYQASIQSYAATPANAQVIRANYPQAGHYGAYGQPLPEYLAAVAGWLDWQLKGDAKAKAMFAGPKCGLCVNPHWWYQSKNVK